MTKREKQLKRFLSVPKDLSFAEFKSVVEAMGFELDDSSGGSHVTFFHLKTNTPIGATKPHGRSENCVKRNYIRDAIEVFRELNLIDEEGNKLTYDDFENIKLCETKQIPHNTAKADLDEQ